MLESKALACHVFFGKIAENLFNKYYINIETDRGVGGIL